MSAVPKITVGYVTPDGLELTPDETITTVDPTTGNLTIREIYHEIQDGSFAVLLVLFGVAWFTYQPLKRWLLHLIETQIEIQRLLSQLHDDLIELREETCQRHDQN